MEVERSSKKGYDGHHLASDHHGPDALSARLDGAFLRGMGFLASLFGVVGRHVAFSETDPALVESRLKAGPTSVARSSRRYAGRGSLLHQRYANFVKPSGLQRSLPTP